MWSFYLKAKVFGCLVKKKKKKKMQRRRLMSLIFPDCLTVLVPPGDPGTNNFGDCAPSFRLSVWLFVLVLRRLSVLPAAMLHLLLLHRAASRRSPASGSLYNGCGAQRQTANLQEEKEATVGQKGRVKD